MKFSVLFISFLILLQSTGLEKDLVQISDLIEHAQYHKEKFNDSFFTFISKHYGGQSKEHKKQHQEEKEQHHKLPFHGEHSHGASLVFVMIPSMFFTSENSIDFFKKDNFYYQRIYESLKTPNIYKPPRVISFFII